MEENLKLHIGMNTTPINSWRNGAARDRKVVVLRRRPRNRWAVAHRGLVALLIGLVAFMILGALVVMFMVDLVKDGILAVVTALTPSP